jgi:hypothetical protein
MRDADWNGLYETSSLPGGGTRWRLPVRRTLGKAVGSAMFLVIFGLLFGGVPVGVFVGAAMATNGWGLLGLPIAAPFALIGLACVLLGLSMVFGRAEVRASGGRLVSIERLGPLALTRRRGVEAIARFEIKGGAMRTNGKALTAARGGEFSTLRAVVEGAKKPWPVTGMYARDTLLSLARELAAACDAQAPRELFEGGPPAVVEVDWRTEEAEVECAPVARPENTPITLEQAEGVTTIRVPPAGSKGSRGLLAFGVLWEIFSGIACALVVWKLATNPSSVSGNPWVAAIVLPLFLLVGGWMIVYGLSLSRRRTVLDIVGGTLLVTRSGLRRVRSWEWPAADLRRVHVGPSGMEVNDEPVLALVIEPRDDRKTILLAERSERELRWIAWEVGSALGLHTRQASDAA